ncbi:hypothetical protein [Nostoc sp. ChiVER01]|uniref:hypothetical protein n=1 Tax=Nostoc sp. ChiVER01 TaxID=3075382 RepID=UPI002AD30149|nr:hypothetical protein [Nostoc sp. ChiVER01]MDZ8227550.1 hypothetical protein [Nostoc sp. ChiVER01]
MEDITVLADSRDLLIKVFIKTGGNELYKILHRKNYKIPKNYIQWRELAALISVNAPLFNHSSLDLAQRFTAHRIALWVVKDAPIYCLDNQLLEQFQQTDIGDENLIFKDLVSQIPLHSMMLLLPSKTVVSPDGGYVDWLNIHCSHVRHPEWSVGEKYGLSPHYMTHEDDAVLHFGCVDTKGTIWFSGWGIDEAEGKLKQAKISYGKAPVGKNDDNFVQELRSLTMQCLMFLTFEKLETDNVTFKETINSTGFTPLKEPKEKCLYPRWLREGEKRQARHIRENTSHASPVPHWRRGHWRRAAIGKGRLHRRWNWIKPTFVTGSFE